jgi:predicted TIM-barrel fold metal-dependent hydrolase
MDTISPTKVPEIFDGIAVIDTDTHITEPHDLWTSRAPAKFKDRVPQIKAVNDKLCWVIDGDKPIGSDMPNSAILRDGSKVGVTYSELKFDDVHEGSYDIKKRVAFMDETGIRAQIAYPNLLGFSGANIQVIGSDVRLLSTQIYNDAMAELQAESGNRVFPMILLPWWDVKESIAEVKRCHAMGMRGINTNPEPQTQGLPDLSDKYWYPLWEVCSDLGLSLNFHIGSSDISANWYGTGRWPSLDKDPSLQLAFGSNMMFISNFRIFVNILLSGFLEDFPTLKIVSVESGIGWVPAMLDSLEYQMKENWLKHKVSPWEIFSRQMYVTAWYERRHFAASARMVGIDNVMFETDFPHPTCLYPGALNMVAGSAAEFTPDERRKVFEGNAARVYNISPTETSASHARSTAHA